MHFRCFFFFAMVCLTALPVAAALRGGRVVDPQGEPVPQTSVIVRETLEGARTDENGNFMLEVPESGSVTFVITAPGRPAVERSVTIRADQPLVLQVDAIPSPQVNLDPMTPDGGPRRTGKVIDPSGDPVPHSTVIVRETLEGARTDENGNFTIRLPESGVVTFVITAPSKPAVERVIDLHADEPLVLQLDSLAAPQVNMAPVTVIGVGGKPPPTVARGSILTVLDIVSVPGGGAGMNRALQTLPGVQNADEGDALFVRGGDYWETGAYINGSLFPSAVRLEAPTGTFVGTVNAFLAKKISFAAGGFGARYGNLLSGVVTVETLDAPTSPEGTFNLGMGAVSVGLSQPLGKSAGARFTGTYYDFELTMKLNGSDVKFEPPPKGSDLSGSVVWEYRPGAQLKLFSIQQSNQFGVQINEPTFQAIYQQRQSSHFSVLSLKDNFSGLAVTGDISTGQSHTTENFGYLDLDTRLPSTRASVQAAYSEFGDLNLSLSAGVEYERVGLRMTGSRPASYLALAPGSASTDIHSRVDGRRNGVFLEADWIATPRLHAIAGIRTDQSSLTDQRTLDPRFSLSYKLTNNVLLTSAVGLYHQVPDILFYNPWLGGGGLPSMRATHTIVGVQFGEGDRQLKIEAYRKGYDRLDQLTFNRYVARDGTGGSQGIDIFAKYPLPYKVAARVTVSLLDAVRTDPNTGILSRAPFGIRNSTTVILTRNFPKNYQASLAWRASTGRPFTVIDNSFFDPTSGIYIPLYAEPYAARLPFYQRFDFNLSKTTQWSPKFMTIWYLAVNNVLGQKNITGYSYSIDYKDRQEKPSIFNRSFYVGFSLIFR